jgi:hypothetical protein
VLIRETTLNLQKNLPNKDFREFASYDQLLQFTTDDLGLSKEKKEAKRNETMKEKKKERKKERKKEEKY